MSRIFVALVVASTLLLTLPESDQIAPRDGIVHQVLNYPSVTIARFIYAEDPKEETGKSRQMKTEPAKIRNVRFRNPLPPEALLNGMALDASEITLDARKGDVIETSHVLNFYRQGNANTNVLIQVATVVKCANADARDYQSWTRFGGHTAHWSDARLMIIPGTSRDYFKIPEDGTWQFAVHVSTGTPLEQHQEIVESSLTCVNWGNRPLTILPHDLP